MLARMAAGDGERAVTAPIEGYWDLVGPNGLHGWQSPGDWPGARRLWVGGDCPCPVPGHALEPSCADDAPIDFLYCPECNGIADYPDDDDPVYWPWEPLPPRLPYRPDNWWERFYESQVWLCDWATAVFPDRLGPVDTHWFICQAWLKFGCRFGFWPEPKPGVRGASIPCRTCDGQGWFRPDPPVPGMPRVTCGHCRGVGTRWVAKGVEQPCRGQICTAP